MKASPSAPSEIPRTSQPLTAVEAVVSTAVSTAVSAALLEKVCTYRVQEKGGKSLNEVGQNVVP